MILERSNHTSGNIQDIQTTLAVLCEVEKMCDDSRRNSKSV